LASLGAVEDLGDFPPHATIKAGELWTTTPTTAIGPVEAAAITTLLDLPVRGGRPGQLTRSRLSVYGAHRHLTTAIAGYDEQIRDVAGTWDLMADLHDRGLLDVSAAPSRHLVTALRVRASVLPAAFQGAARGKSARAAQEIDALRDFFADNTTCANRKLADYFGAPDLPDGCCTDATNMCSACWDAVGADHLVGQVKPAVAEALDTPPRQAGSRVDRNLAARRLDRRVELLVWDVFRGVSAWDLYRALRGEDSYYNAKLKKRFKLPTALVANRYFGSSPAVRLADIEDALGRLEGSGTVTKEGTRWRDSGNVARHAAQQARIAAQAAAQAGV